MQKSGSRIVMVGFRGNVFKVGNFFHDDDSVFTSSLEKIKFNTFNWLMQVFSLLADWHRCSSTHHRCPSANNHVANDSSVWQTIPSWFLWYLWASLSLVLAESRWDFNFVACSYGLVVSLWLLHSWWVNSAVRLFMVWDYLNAEQAILFFDS